jgi:hypothetical protein
MSRVRYRGREVSEADVEFIRELVVAHPQASRRALSLKLCSAWQWVQPNGVPCDAVARELLLVLSRSGRIELPEPRYRHTTPYHRKKPGVVEIDSTPIRARLSALQPLEFRQVRRTEEESLFNGLIETYHYLGYRQPVGAHLKYLVLGQGRPVACVSWSSAARHLEARDRFIGWSAEARRRNLRFIAYNPRFLILPWVFVPHLASHILGRMARLLPREWEQSYGNPVFYLESFVEPARYRGTCYRAANWTVVGLTKGLGKDSRSKRPNRTIKQVLGYPLTKRFREKLSSY